MLGASPVRGPVRSGSGRRDGVSGVSDTAWIRNVLFMIGSPPPCSELRRFERIQTPFRAFLCIWRSKLFGAKSGAHSSGEAGSRGLNLRPFRETGFHASGSTALGRTLRDHLDGRSQSGEYQAATAAGTGRPRIREVGTAVEVGESLGKIPDIQERDARQDETRPIHGTC
jgi:hypothetical protein